MTAATNSPTSSTNRRSFYICCGRRFTFSAQNVLDAFLTACTILVEKAVLILGPLLICFASVIIGGLSWTFFTILVPMMQRDLVESPFRLLIIGSHCAFVMFLLVEIIFNYFMCVMTRNKGPHYDKVVRELAEVTHFAYPETPQDVAAFRRDFNDKMMLRIRRRQARETEQQMQLLRASRDRDGTVNPTNNGNDLGTSSGANTKNVTTTATATTSKAAMTLDIPSNGTNSINGTSNVDGDGATSPASCSGDGTIVKRKTTKQNVPSPAPRPLKQPTPKQIRDWMIMAPDEWGFCSRSNQPKPPRAHYDHVTKTLVLCLDHYCPWMFNAVGYFNYRYFCNFLWFVELAMMYGCFMAYRPFANVSSPNYRKQVVEFRKSGVWSHTYPYTPSNTERMPVTMSFMLCLAVGLAVLCLAGFHLYLVLTAQTTIEFHGNFVNRNRAKKLGQKWRNPYDLGWRRNLQHVYGTQPFLLAFLIPSTREPEFLPLPLPGEDGKRKHLRKRRDDRTTTTTAVELGHHDEEQDGLLKSLGDVEIV